jgi:NAD(P)H-dependent FMN reductase
MYTLISSTNRKGSNTLRLTEVYRKILEDKGESTEIISLMDLPENILVSDLYGKRSPDFQKLQDKIMNSPKFIFLIPEYNGSFPGALKIFIDALDYPGSFTGKKAALVGLSSGTYGNIRGIDHFTGVCHYIGLNLLPLKIHIPFIKKELDATGNIPAGTTLDFIHQQINAFIRF